MEDDEFLFFENSRLFSIQHPGFVYTCNKIDYLDFFLI